MGRQVYFSMSAQDESCFFQYLKNRWNARIVLKEYNSCHPNDFIESESDLSEHQYKLYIWNPSITSGLKKWYISEKIGSIVDPGSEVIEYSRRLLSRCDFRSCFPGEMANRIYMNPYYLSSDKESLLKKSEKFIKWYESVARWIKNRSIGKIDQRATAVYVMPDAKDFLLEHGVHINFKTKK